MVLMVDRRVTPESIGKGASFMIWIQKTLSFMGWFPIPRVRP